MNLLNFALSKLFVTLEVSGLGTTSAPASTLPRVLTILKPLILLPITSSLITLPLNTSISVFGLGSRKASGSAGLFLGCSCGCFVSKHCGQDFMPSHCF